VTVDEAIELPTELPGRLALSRATVDRAAERRRDRAWLADAWADPRTRVLVVGEGRVPVVDGRLELVSPAEAPPGDRFLLGVDSGTPFLAVHVDMRPDHSQTLREVGAVLGDRDAGLAVHAIALANWHDHHRHCPRCGAPTVVEAAGHVRRCTVDDSEHFPRTDPAVIMLVVDENDRCLLARQSTWPERRYSTLAGFVEPGETPEHAVVREVLEEVGITVRTCRYVDAQPWPFPSSLMLGYYATAHGEQPKPDGEEIDEARWFSRDEIQAAVRAGEMILPGGISIARHLVEGWLGRPVEGAVPWPTL
jgi:NAD+ diphosphatase